MARWGRHRNLDVEVVGKEGNRGVGGPRRTVAVVDVAVGEHARRTRNLGIDKRVVSEEVGFGRIAAGKVYWSAEWVRYIGLLLRRVGRRLEELHQCTRLAASCVASIRSYLLVPKSKLGRFHEQKSEDLQLVGRENLRQTCLRYYP